MLLGDGNKIIAVLNYDRKVLEFRGTRVPSTRTHPYSWNSICSQRTVDLW